jgi:hypothetical protein
MEPVFRRARRVLSHRKFPTLVTILSTMAMAGAAYSQTCALDVNHPIIVPRNPGEAGDTQKRAYRLCGGSIVFLGRFTIDADGHPRAYGPNGTGLDALGNAGRPGKWWALATNRSDCGETGTPVLQQSGDPAPGFFVSRTSLTRGIDCHRQANYVHSGEIPFVALPPALGRITQNRGQLAVVHNPASGATGFAVQADAAPASGIGEGSMALARRLGLNDSPLSGGTNVRRLVYLVLPARMGFPGSADEVDANASAAFAAWGGAARLAACRSALEQAPR